MQILWCIILAACGVAYSTKTVDVGNWKVFLAHWEILGTDYQGLRISKQEELISDLATTLGDDRRWPLFDHFKQLKADSFKSVSTMYDTSIKAYVSDVNASDADKNYEAAKTAMGTLLSEIKEKQDFYLRNLLLFIRAHEDNMNLESIKLIIKYDLRRYIEFFRKSNEFLDVASEYHPDESITIELKSEFSNYITKADRKWGELNETYRYYPGAISRITMMFATRNDHKMAVESLKNWINAVRDAYKGIDDFDTYTDRLDAVEKVINDSSHFMEALDSAYPTPPEKAWFIMDVNTRSILIDTCLNIIKTFNNGVNTPVRDGNPVVNISDFKNAVVGLNNILNDYGRSIATALESVPIDEAVIADQDAAFETLTGHINTFLSKLETTIKAFSDTAVQETN